MNIKYFLAFLFCMLSVSAQVRVPGTLTNGGNAYPVAPVGLVSGAPQIVATFAALSNVPVWLRATGQLFHVLSPSSDWRLVGGTNNANLVEVTTEAASGLVTNIPQSRIRKISQIVSRKNREALSNELVIAQFLFTGGPASNTLAYNPRNVGPSRSLFIRDAMQCVEAHPTFFGADQLRGWARAFTNNISGIDLFCSEQMQSGVNGYGPYFDSQFDFVWLTYEHFRKTRAPTLFLEMQPRIEAAITRVKSSPFMSNSIPFVSLDTMGGWGFHDTILFETNYNVGMDMQSAMFWIRTCRQLAEMYNASGQVAKGSNALVDLAHTSASVMTNFWSEERGLFRSYQLSITNHSIVGSALAVVYDAVPKAVQQRIIAELISGLPGGEDFAAGNGFFKHGGIRFWPANEHPGITNSQNGGYWPGFAGYVAKAIQYDNPELAEHIVSYHITNTVRLVQAGVTNHIRVGQLEWFGAELSVDPTAFGYNNNIQSQAGGVIAPESTEIFSGFVEGEGSFSKISSMTNGPLEIPSETRFGGGTFPHTLDPGGLVLDNGETTTPSLRFAFGNNLNFGIGSDSFTLWFVYNFLETNGVVLGRWQGDGKLLSLGGFLAAGGVFTGDGSGLTNLSIAGISAALTNNETRSVTLSNTLSVVGETKIGGGNFAHITSPGLRFDNGETTTPSLKFAYGDNLNFGIGADSFTLRFAYNLDETGGIVLGRWQGDGLLLSLGGFLAAGGVFTGDGSGLTNLSGVSASYWFTNAVAANSISNAHNVTINGDLQVGDGSYFDPDGSGYVSGSNVWWLMNGYFYATSFYGDGGGLTGLLGVNVTTPVNDAYRLVDGDNATALTIGDGIIVGRGDLVFTGDGSGLTNLPFNALSLAGRQAVTNAASGGGGTPAGADGNVQYNNGGAFGGENAFWWDDANDRLGIGTSSPSASLHVVGDILGTGTLDIGGSSGVVFNSNIMGPKNNYYVTMNGGYSFNVANSDVSVIYFRVLDSNGNVGIGETAPASKLSVSGNVSIGVGVDTTAASDNGLLVEGFISHGGSKRVSTQYDATTTTLGTATGLSVTVVTGKTYRFRVVLDCTLDATGGGKYAIGGTAIATAINYRVRRMGASLAVISSSRQTSLGSAVNSTAALTDDDVVIDGLITVNAGGTLAVQFAQQSAVGTSSVLVGSTFTVEKVE